MPRRKRSTTVYLTPEQDARLRTLHGETRIPVADLIRQGIDLVLERHRERAPAPPPAPRGHFTAPKPS